MIKLALCAAGREFNRGVCMLDFTPPGSHDTSTKAMSILKGALGEIGIEHCDALI